MSNIANIRNLKNKQLVGRNVGEVGVGFQKQGDLQSDQLYEKNLLANKKFNNQMNLIEAKLKINSSLERKQNSSTGNSGVSAIAVSKQTPNIPHHKEHLVLHDKKTSLGSKAKIGGINDVTFQRIQELFAQELFMIKQYWEDLGTCETYKKLFLRVSAEMDNSHIKSYYDLEIKQLKNFAESLLKLDKDIKARESTITFIKNINENYLTGQLSKKIVQDTVLALKNLRVISINITNHSKKIREVYSYYLQEGKYDLDRLKKNFNYDKYYLIKMKDDVEFLRHSAISKFFTFSNDSDPFLLGLKLPNLPEYLDSNSDKYNLDLNEDMLAMITSCQYVILQDLILMEIKNLQAKEEALLGRVKPVSAKPKLDKLGKPGQTPDRASKTPLKHDAIPSTKKTPVNERNKTPEDFNNRNHTPSQKQNLIPVKQVLERPKSRTKISKETKDAKEIKEVKDFLDKVQPNIRINHPLVKAPQIDSEKAEMININQLLKEKENISMSNNYKTETNLSLSKAHLKDEKISFNVSEEEFKIREESGLDLSRALREKKESHKSEDIIGHEVSVLAESKYESYKVNHSNTNSILHQSEYSKFKHEPDEHDRELITVSISVAPNAQSPRTQYRNEHQNYETFDESTVKEIVRESVRLEVEEKDVEFLNKLNNKKQDNEKQDSHDKHIIPNNDNENDAPMLTIQESTCVEAVAVAVPVSGVTEAPEFQDTPDSIDIKSLWFEYLTADIESEEVKEFYKRYIKKVDDEQKLAFKVPTDFSSFNKGITPRIIFIKSIQSTIGLAVVSYENNEENKIRLSLSHFTTFIWEKYEEILLCLKDFLVREMPCEEVHVSLYYKNVGETFDINNDIKNAFKKLRFRWLKVENTLTERYVKMNLVVNDESNQDKLEKMKGKFMLSIKYSATIQLKYCTTFNDVASARINYKEENLVNIFPLLYSISELVNKEKYQLLTDKFNFGKIAFDKLKRIAGRLMKYYMSNNADIVNGYLNDFFNGSVEPNFYANQENNFHTTYLNFATKFKNFTTTTLQIGGSSFIFNRISGDSLEVLENKETGELYYLIPAGDGRHSILIVEMEHLEDTNICEFFYRLYPKLEPVENSEKKSIWVPAFEIKSTSEFKSIQLMAELQVQKNEKIYKIQQLYEMTNLRLMYDDNYKQTFKSTMHENDVIIKKNFLVALINLEILSEFNIPAVYLSYISKSNWISI